MLAQIQPMMRVRSPVPRALSRLAMTLLALACVSFTAIAHAVVDKADLNVQLMKAVDDNRLDDVRSLLACGADVNAAAWGWSSPLELAVDQYLRNDRETARRLMIDLLLKSGSNVNKPGYKGRTALMQAASRGDLELTALFISRGANVNARDQAGSTALLGADSWDGYEKLFDLLVEGGGDLRAVDQNRTTLLMRACEAGSVEVAAKLLKAGLKPNAKDRSGRTAIMFAAQSHQAEDFRVIAPLLLDRGADPRARDNQGRSVLMYAAQCGDVAIVSRLLDTGVPVEERDRDGRTALTHAAESRRYDVAQALLDRGANVNHADRRGGTSLMACVAGRSLVSFVDMEMLLVQRGARIDLRDREGRTALHYAARSGYGNSAAYLLRRGADVHAVDRRGRTPLHFAVDWGFGPEQAGIGNYGRAVQPLLDAGADPNARDAEGNTPFLVAASHIQSVKYLEPLLEAGADVNARNRKGTNAAAWYLRFQRTEDVKALLARGATYGIIETLLVEDHRGALRRIENGADPNTRGPFGQTALMLAAEKAYPDVVKELLDRGARANDRDDFDMTALHFAVRCPTYSGPYAGRFGYAQPRTMDESELREIVRRLLDAGADPNAANKDKRMAIETAQQNRLETISTLLLERGARPPKAAHRRR